VSYLGFGAASTVLSLGRAGEPGQVALYYQFRLAGYTNFMWIPSHAGDNQEMGLVGPLIILKSCAGLVLFSRCFWGI